MVLSVEQVMREKCKNQKFYLKHFGRLLHLALYIFSCFAFTFLVPYIFTVLNWRSELFCPFRCFFFFFFGLGNLKHVDEKSSINC